MTDFTIAEAVTRLDPPISVGALRALVVLSELSPTGVTRGGRGRPALTYDSAALDQLHADWVDGRITTRRFPKTRAQRGPSVI